MSERRALTWLEDLPILDWMIPAAGCLDVDSCPDSWERNAHLERYGFACQVLRGVRVLDFGCGTGYGSEMLARAGNRVTGCDASEEALEIASERRGNFVRFVSPEKAARDGFDATVAFEVLEHLSDPEGFLDDVADRARHLVISTPIVPTTKNNPWHRHDFTLTQLRTMIGRRFEIRCEWFQTRPWRSEPCYVILHGATKG